LHLPPENKPREAPKLYNLSADIGESVDVAAANPETIANLRALAEAMKGDLGLDNIGPGCRALGKVANAQPIIGFDGKPRPGFEAK